MACHISTASPNQRHWNVQQIMQQKRPVPAISTEHRPEQARQAAPPRMQQHHHHAQPAPPTTAVASFRQAKSPVSHCIDTIIGAAEVLAKRDAWFAEHPPPKQRNTMFMHPLEQRLETDEYLQKKLVLTMALQRPRAPPNPHPTKMPSRLIGEGFYWKEYPIIEDVLYEHMEEYYEWSTRERQSKHQQAFNNALVAKVRVVAAAQGNVFDPMHFSDKRLRDRIRCFYKTHLQNAKKRLMTMKKHIDTDEQRRAIQELIEKANNTPKFVPKLIPVVSTSDDDSDMPKKKRQRSH